MTEALLFAVVLPAVSTDEIKRRRKTPIALGYLRHQITCRNISVCHEWQASGVKTEKSRISAALFYSQVLSEYGDDGLAQRGHIVWGHTRNVNATRRYGVDAKLLTQAQHLLFGQTAK